MTTQGQTALVADDHELFGAALAAILKRDLGFQEVIGTRSVDEAFAALTQAPHIAFATFDMAMPGTAERLADIRDAFPALRIAVVSASVSRDDRVRALACGVDGYVPKQLGMAELKAALRAIADGIVFMPTLPDDAAEPAEDGDGSGPVIGGLALPPRQREVLRLLADGRSNKEIARRLNLAEGTVKLHLAGLFRKLGVRDRAGAAEAAARLVE
jgi:DNA-binding NarL/FixJ family response regulator